MAITFTKGSYFSSEQYNQRFADLLGGSILKGFYLSKGTGNFSVSVTSGADDKNLLITSEGIRIEETNDFPNAFSVKANMTGMVRIDAVYVQFENTVNNQQFTFAIQEGEPGGELPYFLDNVLHTLIGFVVVPANNEQLTADSFNHPSRGVKLGKVAGGVDFEDEVNLGGGATAPDPLIDGAIATKGYVDRTMKENIPTYIHNDLSVEVSNYDATNFVYKHAKYTRPDGTRYMTSDLSELSPAGNYEQIVIKFYDESGANLERTELWGLTYDSNRNVLSKKIIR